MIKHIRFSNFLRLLASLTLIMVSVVMAKNSKENNDRYKRVCYYTNWSQYRRDQGKFLPTNIDPHLCTHLIFAFAKIDKGVLAPYEWNDLQYPFLYKQFNALKEKNPELKTLLAVGGWTHGSQPFTEMVTNKSSRQKFIQHAIDYLRTHGFDGLDLDWEYPANRGSPEADKERFTFLVQELREAFEVESKKTGKDRLLLTAAVAGGERLANSGYEVKILNRYIDFFNLMSYDLHGSWSPVIGHHAPLIGGEKWMESKGDSLSVEQSVNLWLKLGADPTKLVMGLALYGKTFKLCTKGFEPGDKSCGSATPDTLNYYEILQKLKSGKYVKKWMDNEIVPYAYSPSDKLWVGYDDEESIRAKVKFAKKKNLAGVMVWAIDGDDFSGQFGDGVKYPLMNVIRDSIEGIKDDVLKHSTNMKQTSVKEKSEENSKNISFALIDEAPNKNQQKLILHHDKKVSTDSQTPKINFNEDLAKEQVIIDKVVDRNTKTTANNISTAQKELELRKKEIIQNKPITNSTNDEKADTATFINSPVIIKKLPDLYSELNKELFEKPMAVPLHANLLAAKEVSSSTLVKNTSGKPEYIQRNITIHNTAAQLRQRLKQSHQKDVGSNSNQLTSAALSPSVLKHVKSTGNVLNPKLTQRARGLQKKGSQKKSSSVFSPPKETIYQYPTFVKYSSKANLISESLKKDSTVDKESDVPWFTEIKSVDNNKIDDSGDTTVGEIKTKIKKRPFISHPKNDIVPFSKSVGQFVNDKRVEENDPNDKFSNELTKVVEKKNPSFGRYVTLFPEEVEGWRTTVMAGTDAPEWVSRLMVKSKNDLINKYVNEESNNLLTVHSLDETKENLNVKPTKDFSQISDGHADNSAGNLAGMESNGGKVFVKAMRPSSIHLQKQRSKSLRRNYLPTPYKSLSPFVSQKEKLSRNYEQIPKISKYSRFNEEEMASFKQSHLKPNLKYQKSIQPRRVQELDKIKNNIETGANKWWDDLGTTETPKVDVLTVSSRLITKQKIQIVDGTTSSITDKFSSTIDGSEKLSSTNDVPQKLISENNRQENLSSTNDGQEKLDSTNDAPQMLSFTNNGQEKFSFKNDGQEKLSATTDGPEKLNFTNNGPDKLSSTNDGPETVSSKSEGSETVSSTNDSFIVATVQKRSDVESNSEFILGDTNENIPRKTQKTFKDFKDLKSYLNKETSTLYYRGTRNQEEITTTLPKTPSRGPSLPSRAQYKNNQQWWLVTTTTAPGHSNIKGFKKQKFVYAGRKYHGDVVNNVQKDMSGLTETHPDKGNLNIDEISPRKTSTGDGVNKQNDERESVLIQDRPLEVKLLDTDIIKEMDKDTDQDKTNITHLTLEPILITENKLDAETFKAATRKSVFPDSQPYHSKLTLQTFKHNSTPEKIYHYRHSPGQNEMGHGHQKVNKLAENEIPHNDVSLSSSVSSFTPDIKDWTKIRNLLRNSTVVAEIKSKLDEIHRSVTRDLTTQLPTEVTMRNDVTSKIPHSGKWYERKNEASKTTTEQSSSSFPSSEPSTIRSNKGAVKSLMSTKAGANNYAMTDSTITSNSQQIRDSKQSVYDKPREIQEDRNVIPQNKDKDVSTTSSLQEISTGKTKDKPDNSALNVKLQWWEKDLKSNGKYPDTSITNEESNTIYPSEPLPTKPQVKEQISEKFSSEQVTVDVSNKSNLTTAVNSRGTSQIEQVGQRYNNNEAAVGRVLKNAATVSQYPVTKPVVKPSIMKGLREFHRPKNYNGYVVNNYKREGLRKNSATNAYKSNLYSGSVKNSSKVQSDVSKIMTAYGLKDSRKLDYRQLQTNTILGNEPFQAKNTVMIEIVTQPGQTLAYNFNAGRVTGSPENSFRYKAVKNTGSFSCPSTFGIYADSKDCRKFYQCVWNVAFHHMCGRGTAWNQEDRICDWPKRTDCLLSTEESAN